ncbi:MAG: lactate racemase domain-containing protein [Candidatus Hodarchaeales archaeon]
MNHINKERDYLETPVFYDNMRIDHFVPKETNCEFLKVPKIKTIANLKEEFNKALSLPINSPTLEELVKAYYAEGIPIAILIDDNTRPNIHTRAILPLLEKELIRYGVQKNDIKLVIATGTHTPPTEEQIRNKILGELFENWKDNIWVHDCDDKEKHEFLGKSSLGTPIFIDKRVLASCIIIPLSDSEYHYFAGVAGSVKLFVPGVSARETVRSNHARIFDLRTGFKTECRMGNIEGNVSIQDIREIVEILIEKLACKIFVIDAIMHKKSFVNIFAGNPLNIHEKANEELAKIRNVRIKERADLVIISKPSVNFYQAGKALNAASHAVKKGGSIYLLAECEDGFGPEDYLQTMEEVKNLEYKEAMQWIIKNKCTEETFEIGIQNAVDIFRILQLTNGNIFVYSKLDQNILRNVFRVKPISNEKSTRDALRTFVRDFLEQKKDALIHVFEDFNILPISP